MAASRQEFAEGASRMRGTASTFDLTRARRLRVALSGRAQLLLGRSPHNVEFDACPGTSGHIRYFTSDTLEQLLKEAGLVPFVRSTDVAYFSALGSSELVGRLRPSPGHTLISLAEKPHAHRPGA